jgi:deoxyribose-phosphate aldolase
MANLDDRKKRIMEHIARSKGDFIKRSTSNSSVERKQQIMDHIRRTSG